MSTRGRRSLVQIVRRTLGCDATSSRVMRKKFLEPLGSRCMWRGLSGPRLGAAGGDAVVSENCRNEGNTAVPYGHLANRHVMSLMMTFTQSCHPALVVKTDWRFRFGNP
jgi:hypothetical protein